LRELVPGTWYTKDGKIFIEHEDGTTEVLSTSWERDRRAAAAQEAYERAEALKKHLAEKRAAPPEKGPVRGR
jgi:hypothetical protein